MSEENDTPFIRGFASDNYAGAHAEVLEALTAANVGHVGAYGEDPITAQFGQTVKRLFGAQAETYPVFNGTGANVVSLAAMLPRWGAVVCTETAHIHVDEGGAPEKASGVKLLTCATVNGKLTPADVESVVWAAGDQHRAQPLAVSLAQSTELGTTYTVDELRDISRVAHENNMLLHIDGSRLANAAVHLHCELREISTEIGADIVSLGGTKNGLIGAEAIVVLNPDLVHGLDFLRKHHMQLASKMRFISAQLQALYGTDLWQRSAEHSNAMATRLRVGLDQIKADGAAGVSVTQATESNGVFATLPPEVAAHARTGYHFYDWPVGVNEVRLMCSFDTTEADVDGLLALIHEASFSA
ncbi:MAG: threonine aldolase family protein [Canibacter sp.]